MDCSMKQTKLNQKIQAQSYQNIDGSANINDKRKSSFPKSYEYSKLFQKPAITLNNFDTELGGQTVILEESQQKPHQKPTQTQQSTNNHSKNDIREKKTLAQAQSEKTARKQLNNTHVTSSMINQFNEKLATLEQIWIKKQVEIGKCFDRQNCLIKEKDGLISRLKKENHHLVEMLNCQKCQNVKILQRLNQISQYIKQSQRQLSLSQQKIYGNSSNQKQGNKNLSRSSNKNQRCLPPTSVDLTTLQNIYKNIAQTIQQTLTPIKRKLQISTISGYTGGNGDKQNSQAYHDDQHHVTTGTSISPNKYRQQSDKKRTSVAVTTDHTIGCSGSTLQQKSQYSFSTVNGCNGKEKANEERIDNKKKPQLDNLKNNRHSYQKQDNQDEARFLKVPLNMSAVALSGKRQPQQEQQQESSQKHRQPGYKSSKVITNKRFEEQQKIQEERNEQTNQIKYPQMQATSFFIATPKKSIKSIMDDQYLQQQQQFLNVHQHKQPRKTTMQTTYTANTKSTVDDCSTTIGRKYNGDWGGDYGDQTSYFQWNSNTVEEDEKLFRREKNRDRVRERQRERENRNHTQQQLQSHPQKLENPATTVTTAQTLSNLSAVASSPHNNNVNSNDLLQQQKSSQSLKTNSNDSNDSNDSKENLTKPKSQSTSTKMISISIPSSSTNANNNKGGSDGCRLSSQIFNVVFCQSGTNCNPDHHQHQQKQHNSTNGLQPLYNLSNPHHNLSHNASLNFIQTETHIQQYPLQNQISQLYQQPSLQISQKYFNDNKHTQQSSSRRQQHNNEENYGKRLNKKNVKNDDNTSSKSNANNDDENDFDFNNQKHYINNPNPINEAQYDYINYDNSDDDQNNSNNNNPDINNSHNSQQQSNNPLDDMTSFRYSLQSSNRQILLDSSIMSSLNNNPNNSHQHILSHNNYLLAQKQQDANRRRSLQLCSFSDQAVKVGSSSINTLNSNVHQYHQQDRNQNNHEKLPMNQRNSSHLNPNDKTFSTVAKLNNNKLKDNNESIIEQQSEQQQQSPYNTQTRIQSPSGSLSGSPLASPLRQGSSKRNDQNDQVECELDDCYAQNKQRIVETSAKNSQKQQKIALSQQQPSNAKNMKINSQTITANVQNQSMHFTNAATAMVCQTATQKHNKTDSAFSSNKAKKRGINKAKKTTKMVKTETVGTDIETCQMQQFQPQLLTTEMLSLSSLALSRSEHRLRQHQFQQYEEGQDDVKGKGSENRQKLHSLKYVSPQKKQCKHGCNCTDNDNYKNINPNPNPNSKSNFTTQQKDRYNCPKHQILSTKQKIEGATASTIKSGVDIEETKGYQQQQQQQQISNSFKKMKKKLDFVEGVSDNECKSKSKKYSQQNNNNFNKYSNKNTSIKSFLQNNEIDRKQALVKQLLKEQEQINKMQKRVQKMIYNDDDNDNDDDNGQRQYYQNVNTTTNNNKKLTSKKAINKSKKLCCSSAAIRMKTEPDNATMSTFRHQQIYSTMNKFRNNNINKNKEQEKYQGQRKQKNIIQKQFYDEYDENEHEHEYDNYVYYKDDDLQGQYQQQQQQYQQQQQRQLQNENFQRIKFQNGIYRSYNEVLDRNINNQYDHNNQSCYLMNYRNKHFASTASYVKQNSFANYSMYTPTKANSQQQQLSENFKKQNRIILNKIHNNFSHK